MNKIQRKNQKLFMKQAKELKKMKIKVTIKY